LANTVPPDTVATVYMASNAFTSQDVSNSLAEEQINTFPKHKSNSYTGTGNLVTADYNKSNHYFVLQI